MKLYDRDFTSITDDEHAEWQAVVAANTDPKTKIQKTHWHKLPLPVRHHDSLFPNNHLDVMELDDVDRLTKQLTAFREMLDTGNVGERQIASFIKTQRAYFVIGGILKQYFSFGHHATFLFPEFPLGTTFCVDYLLVGKSSDGWQFVFVELESPALNSALSNGDLGSAFRKGLSQTADWDTWIESNFHSLTDEFRKSTVPRKPLPNEFVSLDKTRIFYAVVAGRRSDFNDKTYRIRRTQLRDNSHLVIHYDNLADAAQSAIGTPTY